MLATPYQWLWAKYYGGKSRWLASVLPLYMLRHSDSQYGRRGRKFFHVWDVWEQARWCLADDVAAHLEISRATVEEWRQRGVVRAERPRFRRSRVCVCYEDVLKLAYYYRVSRLLNMRGSFKWETVEGYTHLSPEAIKHLAAARAREDGDGN